MPQSRPRVRLPWRPPTVTVLGSAGEAASVGSGYELGGVPNASFAG